MSHGATEGVDWDRPIRFRTRDRRGVFRWKFTTPRRLFSERTQRRGPCIEWIGPQRGGYGLLTASGGIRLQAHRAAWMMAYGEIPDGMVICHHCD